MARTIWLMYGQLDLKTTNISPTAMQLPWVHGLATRVKWSTVNPAPGVYNWTKINELADVCLSYGRELEVCVIAGKNSPEWIYDTCHRYNFVQDGTWSMPLPWDPNFLTIWKTFITEFGAQFENRQDVHELQMTGMGWSGEMILPNTPSQMQELTALGYTDQVMTDACVEIATHFRQAFPTKKLNVAISEPKGIVKGTEVIEAIMPEFANLNLRVQYNGLASNFINGTAFTSPYRTFLQQHNGVIGYQMKTIVSPASVLTMQEMLDPIFYEDLCTYVQIYHQDILNPAYQELLSTYPLADSSSLPPSSSSIPPSTSSIATSSPSDGPPKNLDRVFVLLYILIASVVVLSGLGAYVVFQESKRRRYNRIQ